jgi:hypothetical protein
VLGEVVRGIGVPPSTVRCDRLRHADQLFHHTDSAQHRLSAAVAAQWDHPVIVVARLRRVRH